MKYSNKQIKRIVAIQEFVEISNTLSKLYIKSDNEELSKESISDKAILYKLYCSSIYNLVVAIKNSKDIFSIAEDYDKFVGLINERYKTDNENYYETIEYETSLFKLLAEIRNKCNHFEKDDNDDIVLFEIYIDFKKVEELRIIINSIFSQIYITIDKSQLEKYFLSKPKVRYEIDRINHAINEYEEKVIERNKVVDDSITEDNLKAISLLKKIFEPTTLYRLITEEKSEYSNLNLIYDGFIQIFLKYEHKILTEGTIVEKKIVREIKEFLKENENVSLNKYNANVERLFERLGEISKEEINQ